MKILLTGIAGFIGFHLAKALIEENHEIIGVDNLNDYYDPALKLARLQELGFNINQIKDSIADNNEFTSSKFEGRLSFIKLDLNDEDKIQSLFTRNNFDIVINLAAQAGARDSVNNPRKYVKNNIDGFLNILEGCRSTNVRHLIYASSSSVYGLNGKTPFSENDNVSHPSSLYAATKKSNELMAHAYSYLYELPTTGIRFFTVYGPWGRPDMAPYLFIDSILKDKPIKIFNNGDLWRDFTFIDDVVEGILRIVDNPSESNDSWDAANPLASSSIAPYRIFNLGNSNPVKLIEFVSSIEKITGKVFKKEYMPMQAGDVFQTFSDTSLLKNSFGYAPSTPLETGLKKTIDWMIKYQKYIFSN